MQVCQRCGWKCRGAYFQEHQYEIAYLEEHYDRIRPTDTSLIPDRSGLGPCHSAVLCTRCGVFTETSDVTVQVLHSWGDWGLGHRGRPTRVCSRCGEQQVGTDSTTQSP
ncbi:hypothetical protein B1H29_21375 [Streptomyces pactum]|uniref:Uncharacterized protein n=1 Tax=Streptomyces pactum TaxID=68249 RepID=A0A1S6JBL0_9ACTN|nr:hypothetical protein B1H29_21375 [Streptomyces pactum]